MLVLFWLQAMKLWMFWFAIQIWYCCFLSCTYNWLLPVHNVYDYKLVLPCNEKYCSQIAFFCVVRLARILQLKRMNNSLVFVFHVRLCSNISTTPITAMGCRQFLPLSFVRMKGKHCQKTRCRNGVVDTFGPSRPF